MTRRRWMADEIAGNRAFLTGTHADHLSRVLRARIGQEFDIATGAEVRRGRIIAITPKRVEFELGKEIASPSFVQVTLALAIFKFDRMEWAIEKCTELGAARIIPVIASRTEPHLAAAAAKRTERWRRIALQASEQSRRICPLEISQPLKLKDILDMRARARIVLSETEKEAMLKDIVESHSDYATVILALGPEGGWTDQELKLFRECGWISASLGSTILRAETAAIASLAVAFAELQP